MMHSPCPTNSRMRRTYRPGSVPGPCGSPQVIAERVGAGEIEFRKHTVCPEAAPDREHSSRLPRTPSADRTLPRCRSKSVGRPGLKSRHVERPDVTRKVIEGLILPNQFLARSAMCSWPNGPGLIVCSTALLGSFPSI